MHARLKKLVEEFPRHKNIDALLVTNDTNIRYLTHFHACESWLLATKTRSFYITDFRYVLEACQGLKVCSVKQYSQTPCATLFDLTKRYKIKRLGFDDSHVSVALLKRLKGFCPRRTKLLPASGIVESLREIKDAKEIGAIRESLRLHFKTLALMKKVVRPGITERQVAAKLEGFVKANSAAFSFAPIIAAGANSAYPHAKLTDRVIRNNEPVLLDFGIDIHGYKSDLTRNFFLGKMTPRYKQVFEAVTLAQKESIALIKPGICVADVDLHARKVLRKFGLARYFGHSLGHGVGLDIHEGPRLSGKCSTLLEPGMVVTVEPAVYLPGQFGIRVEDMVLVTKEGCEVLSGDHDQ